MDIISNLDFTKKIKDNPDGNYLFYGEEDYLKSHAIKSLKDAMGIDETLEIFNFIQIGGIDRCFIINPASLYIYVFHL